MKICLLLFLLFPWAICAQQDAYLSLYQFNMPLINPAYAGAEGKHVIALNSRNQWSNAEDSPKTTAFSYSVAGGKNVGIFRWISCYPNPMCFSDDSANGILFCKQKKF